MVMEDRTDGLLVNVIVHKRRKMFASVQTFYCFTSFDGEKFRVFFSIFVLPRYAKTTRMVFWDSVDFYLHSMLDQIGVIGV